MNKINTFFLNSKTYLLRTFSTTSCNKQNILKKYKINNNNKEIFYNLPYNKILEFEKNETGILTNLNSMAINTGIFTGRSPKDKYFVEQEPSKKNIWWGNVNQPLNKNIFSELYYEVQTL